jgi:hypothetical protein
MNIEEEIDRAARFGRQMEDLVYNEAEDGKSDLPNGGRLPPHCVLVAHS